MYRHFRASANHSYFSSVYDGDHCAHMTTWYNWLAMKNWGN